MESLYLINHLFLAFSLIYFFFFLYMLSQKDPVKKAISELPEVTVLVAFRNEEKNIAACCRALNELNYPKDKIKIFLLNDQSEDRSQQIVADFINNKSQFRLLDITEDKNNLSGKINALAQGIQLTSNEFIFVTDADCQPHPGWIKTLLQYYDDNTALISGFTIMDKEQPTFLDKLQKTDMIFLQSMAYLASNSRRPITMLGNNITFRHSVYNTVGGFEAIGFTVNEDHDLMKTILENTNYEVKYIRDKGGPVTGLPMESFSKFIKQRLRWVVGGLNARPFAYALVGLSFIVHSAMVLLMILAQWNIITGTGIGLILGIDYFSLKKSMANLNFKIRLIPFLMSEAFYIIYTHILIIMLPFSKRIKWKGRKYIKEDKGLVRQQ